MENRCTKCGATSNGAFCEYCGSAMPKVEEQSQVQDQNQTPNSAQNLPPNQPITPSFPPNAPEGKPAKGSPVRTIVIVAAVIIAVLVVIAALDGGSGREPDERFVGSWYWMNSVYYQFEDDGTGRMSNSDILWGVEDGTLYICSTPGICRRIGRCNLPTEWEYEFDGDSLTIRRGTIEFTYTRGAATEEDGDEEEDGNEDNNNTTAAADNDDNDTEAAVAGGNAANLAGNWYWLGTRYYVFEDDGTGLMVGQPIFWEIRGGQLRICNTTQLCGNMSNCSAPMEWYFELDGNTLTLTSAVIAGMEYTYTRGN